MHSDPVPPDAATVALLGHDLRAALSEVIGGLRLIDCAALGPTPRAQIARTRAASEALALLLEQALAMLLNDPTAASITLQTEALLHSIQLRWAARCQEHGLGFQLDAKHLPAQLSLDPALLERVLSNLLNNALKYADRGTITCQLQATEDQHLQITVQDQGKGFSPSTLARLYERYNRDENTSKPGSGMGLHIVCEMVTRAGGKIMADNHAGGGAEVVVRLPLPPIAAAKTIPAQVLNNLHLLIADDSETGRLLLSELLTSQGARVTTVPDGLQAIEHLSRESYDALLIDIEMPQISGLEVIAHIRTYPGPLARLPILAITAYQLRANKAAILAAGADGILCKPVLDPHQLAEAVTQVLKRDTVTTEASPQIEPDQFQQLLQMAGPQMAAELLARLHQDLRAAERGLIAASHGLDWPAVRRQTHIMIALAGTAGATFLHQLAQAINDLAHSPVPDRGTFRTLLPQTLEQLDMLIHFIGQQAPIPNPKERR